MRRVSWGWLVVASASAMSAAVANLGPVEWSARPIITLWFLLVGPGLPLVCLLRVEGFVTRWTLAVALSLALDTGVAELLLYSGWWAPGLGLRLLIGFSIAGTLLAAMLALKRAVRPEPLAVRLGRGSGSDERLLLGHDEGTGS